MKKNQFSILMLVVYTITGFYHPFQKLSLFADMIFQIIQMYSTNENFIIYSEKQVSYKPVTGIVFLNCIRRDLIS